MSKTEAGDEYNFGNYGCDQCENVFRDENFLDLTCNRGNFLAILSVIFAK